MLLVLSCFSQDDSDQLIQAKCHFSRAEVDDQIYYLEDDAHVKVKCKVITYVIRLLHFFDLPLSSRFDRNVGTFYVVFLNVKLYVGII